MLAREADRLTAELGAVLAAAAAEPPLRQPPWLRDESAKTLFKDVSLRQLAQARDAWRKQGTVLEKELPPIVMTKTATDLVILHEGRPGAAADEAGIIAPLTVEEMMAASAAALGEAKRATEAVPRATRGDVAAPTGREASTASRRATAKRIIRFRYTFRAPPWSLEPGTKRKPNRRAAEAAGVRTFGRIRLPVAPSHHRYIEILEDEVAGACS